MPPAIPSQTNYSRFAAYLGLALVVIAADQATKAWALGALAGQTMELISRLLYFDLRMNEGAAFSLFSSHPEILACVASLVAVAVMIWLWKTPSTDWPTALALSFVLGGAVGNLIDRFFRGGKVTDFIRVDLDRVGIDWSWPTFNVADSAICIGMAVLVFFTLFPHGEAEEGAESAEATEVAGAVASKPQSGSGE